MIGSAIHHRIDLALSSPPPTSSALILLAVRAPDPDKSFVYPLIACCRRKISCRFPCLAIREVITPKDISDQSDPLRKSKCPPLTGNTEWLI
jgi:hypothetical protein